MNTVFLIAGGGTGAKVAESFIHLCAAGMGPQEAHVLFVDADTSNGNLTRAYETGLAYNRMGRWDWNVRTEVGGGGGFLGFGAKRGAENRTALFGTRLHLYRVTEPIRSDATGALRTAARADQDLDDVFDLFYDDSEQKTDCRDGFRARPNLGCLLLGQHLRTALAGGEGQRFLAALRDAGKGGATVPVVAAASLFGGMGASLLPIVRSTFDRALREGLNASMSTEHYRWAALMMLPHYQPEAAADSVDPLRYLLDTSNALQFYHKTYTVSPQASRPYDVAYLVGSDNPGRNRVRTVLGTGAQANSAYFEEFVAALAVREFAFAPEGGNPVRHFHLPEAQHTLLWDRMPITPEERPVLVERLGYLLHLAAFVLRLGTSNRDQLTQGLLALLRTTSGHEMNRFQFYKHAIDRWASTQEAYRNASSSERPEVMVSGEGEAFVPAMRSVATEYFARLLYWADTALQGDGLALFEFDDRSDYLALYGHLSSLKDEDFGNASSESDNALVRLMRGTVAAMLNAERNRELSGTVLGDFKVRRPALSPAMQGVEVIAPRITLGHVEETLRQEQQAGLLRDYHATRLDRTLS